MRAFAAAWPEREIVQRTAAHARATHNSLAQQSGGCTCTNMRPTSATCCEVAGPACSAYTGERMEPTTPDRGHSALDPQSSAPGAEPAPPGRVLTRPASSVPRAAAVQAAGVAAAPAAPQLSVDVEALVTEDDTPVDNMPSEKQQRLLTEPLYSSWAGPGAGRRFLAAANVGVFAEARNPAIVPDVFLSLDVQVAADWWDKRHRSYFVWEFGKPPGPGGGDRVEPGRQRGGEQAAQVRAHGCWLLRDLRSVSSGDAGGSARVSAERPGLRKAGVAAVPGATAGD